MYGRINCRTIGLLVGVLFSLAFVMPVFVFNKPVVWDDWVWLHSSPDQLRDVAIQLGFWWLAEVNVFIYSLREPNHFLLSIAFLSHLLSVVLIGNAFVKLKVLDDFQLAIWVVCCIISPVLLVRYINSVSFYNLYFVAFVCGSYLFIFCESRLVRLLSAPFFVISFSLNSLIPAYFAVIWFADREFLNEFLGALRQIRSQPRWVFAGVYRLVWVRFINIWPFAMLPLVFYAIRLLSPYPKASVNPYETYNFPQIDSIFWSPLAALSKTLHLSFEVIWFGFLGVNSLSLLLGVCTAAAVLVSLYVVNRMFGFRALSGKVVPFSLSTLKNAFLLFLFSVVLVFPYVLVGKPPVLGSFYESRHFITAQPFLFAFAVLAMSGAARFIGGRICLPRIFGVVVLVMFASIYAWLAVSVASVVWWETKVSNRIIEELRNNRSDIKFWVFDSQLPEFLDERRWNYVYTGYLISAFGDKRNFGISRGEYLGWNQPVMLLNDPYFRRRYNIENYVHQDTHNVVVIKPLRNLTGNYLLAMYIGEMFGVKYSDMGKLVSINVFPEFGCVDEIVSLFSSGAVGEGVSSAREGAYCRKELEKYCAVFSGGAQSVRLGKIDHAYALQKYPSMLDAEGGLRLFNSRSDVSAEILKTCSSYKREDERWIKADGVSDGAEL